jgi:hypothetical protein
VNLRSVRVTDPGTSPWSFAWLRQEMAEPPAFPTRTATWMFGEQAGVAVVVRPVVLPGNHPYVAVVAEIDPPLLTGLYLLTHSLRDPFKFDGVPPPMGMPPIDRVFISRAHDRARALRLFLRAGPNDDFAWALGEAGSRNPLCIDDRSVSSYIAGAQPADARIEEDLDLVTSLARRLSERTRLVPERPDEVEARESWSRAAAGWSLVFDPARWTITGEHEGRRIGVLLDGTPPAISTIVRVSFRMPLGAGLFMRSGIREKKTVSASGYPELDRGMLFDARDYPRALAAIADPSVRQALAAEASIANVAMTDWTITSARGGFMRGREVSAHIEALASIVDRVTPLMRTAGPFR